MKGLVTVAALAALVSGCSTALTPQALSPAVSRTFSGLYVGQQQLLGRTDVSAADLHALGSCRRSSTAAEGPGEDWLCTVQYVDAVTSSAQTFEVQLKADGCWKADGPPATQPAVLVDPGSGRQVTNPLSEFDGCLDTSW